MRLTATVSGSVSIKIMNNTCSESSGREFYPSSTSTLLHVMYWTFRCYVVLIPSLPLPSFLDPLGAHEPVAAGEPPRARDIDHAAGPGGHPRHRRRRRRRRGHGGGQQPNATPLREGGPGGSPWVGALQRYRFMVVGPNRDGYSARDYGVVIIRYIVQHTYIHT